MIVCENLGYTYRDTPVIADITCTLQEDHIYLITGPSGCGKSTLALLLAGLAEPTKGEIRIDGRKLTVQDAMLLFQNPNLQFCMDTVWNELLFVLENLEIPPEEMPAKAQEALAFANAEGLKDRVLTSLSGGEKQRIGLACLYLLQAPLLILDEPFASLDIESAKALWENIIALQRKTRCTMVVIDHLLPLYEGIDKTTWSMEAGQLVEGDFDLLLAQYREPPTALLSTCTSVSGMEPVVSMAQEGPILEWKHLVVTRGTRRFACEDVTLYPGELIALTGASGVGKSTLLQALMGLYPYQGSCYYEGLPLGQSKRPIGFLFQNPMDQFIYARVELEMQSSCMDSEQAKSILQDVQLYEKRGQSPFRLSQGEQRRLAWATVYASYPRLLLLDEPTYGQDHALAVRMMDRIRHFARETGAGVLFTSHDPYILRYFADRIVRMEIDHAATTD